MNSSSLKFLTTTILLACANYANASAYTFTELTAFQGTESYANAINNAGQVVGGASNPHLPFSVIWNGAVGSRLDTTGEGNNVSSFTSTAINNAGQVVGGGRLYSAIVWNGGVASTLGGFSRAYAINDAGRVAGWTFFPSTGNNIIYGHAARWDGSIATDLGTLGGNQSGAYGINSAGQVAGYSDISGNTARHAALWSGSTSSDLGTLGGNQSGAYAINNAGQVVGYSEITGNAMTHATLWDGTAAVDLGTLGGDNSYALAINSFGQIAGYSNVTGSTAMHATLWNGGAAVDLNSLLDADTATSGWVLNEARGINDNGWIVGVASNSRLGINQRAFLLAPVPEPETYAMLLVGLGLLGAAIRRRNKV